ncbi:hypothetical protein P255_01463 [Acinetobacter brisouii CIP 110357]|uniref:Sulfur relay protein TusB/DsrH n=1 Tax=Acinetobacter brisouii CIP 110357 TaxID=1341683 RepID=V2U973_9GAMM|nr:hypothetical protein [Acinetobacter brisouii]ENV48063.1 hypothetical protein F954_01130 [Acinetobacter brisouii ANC 4119]ESK50963.1 hypothetical protein P255_01463 [Acinetobacter brisouii CIP 110357]
MSNSTLFLIQGDYSKAASLLTQLQQMATPQDQIVLMAESILLYAEPALESYTLYILKADTDVLPEVKSLPLNIIDYSEFSNLLLQHTRCISLK